MGQDKQFDALKFLSETHRLLHEKRQKYEWKIIFASLTFFVASVVAVYSQKIYLPEAKLIKALIWVLFLSFAFVTACFLRSIHTANARNKSFAEDAERNIKAMVNQQSIEKLTFSMDRFRKTYWAFYWQAFLIAVLAIVAATMLTCSNPTTLNAAKAVDAQASNQGMERDWEKRATFSLLRRPSKSHLLNCFQGCSKLFPAPHASRWKHHTKFF